MPVTLKVEALEDRKLFDITAVISSGILSVTSDVDQDIVISIQEQEVNGNAVYYVQVNGIAQLGPVEGKP